MKFLIKFQKTALNIAVENGDSEIVQLLLSNEKTDLNSVDTIFFSFENEISINNSWFYLNIFIKRADKNERKCKIYPKQKARQ